jgi:hypothetical protein
LGGKAINFMFASLEKLNLPTEIALTVRQMI